MSTHTNNCR